jgi:hypothetical protein
MDVTDLSMLLLLEAWTVLSTDARASQRQLRTTLQ